MMSLVSLHCEYSCHSGYHWMNSSFLWMYFGCFARKTQYYVKFGGVEGCIERALYRLNWMGYQHSISVLTGVKLINNDLCLDSWICRWVRPEGVMGIYYTGHVEAYVAWHIYLIVGNEFTRGVCDWKYFSSIVLDGRYLEGLKIFGEQGLNKWLLYNWIFKYFWSGNTMGAFE